MEVCSNGPDHMTKIAAMPIYGKNPLKFLSRTRRPWYVAIGMLDYQICSYDDPSYL